MSQATHLLPSPHGTARFPFGFRVNPLMFVSIKTNEADGAH